MRTPPAVALIGPAGSGKTTIGQRLAPALRVPFVDADDFHPPANRQRMAAGLPLDDAARWPWLDAVREHLAGLRASGFVLACSALRQSHRQRLAAGLPPFAWIALRVRREELVRRLADRAHFFAPSLLDDQLATWEPPTPGPAIDGEQAPESVVAAILAALAAPG